VKLEVIDLQQMMGHNQPPAEDVVCGWVLRLYHPHDLRNLATHITREQFLQLKKSRRLQGALKQVLKMHINLEKKCRRNLS